MDEMSPQTEYELRELIKEYRNRANEADDGLPGAVEYRLYHEVANDLSDIVNDD